MFPPGIATDMSKRNSKSEQGSGEATRVTSGRSSKHSPLPARRLHRKSLAGQSPPDASESLGGAQVLGRSPEDERGVTFSEEDNLLRLYAAEYQEETQDPQRAYKRAWLYPELPWGAPPEWDQQGMRGTLFLQIWDVLTFVCCLYVAVSVPYLVSFNSATALEGGCIFSDRHVSQTKAALSVANVVVDFVFTADIVINFHQARWVISTVGTPHWVLIDDLRRLRKMYFFGGFLSDFVGQIPWQYLDCIFPAVDENLKILRLLRLLKLFRLYRVRRMIQALYRKFPDSEVLITALELLLTLCIAAHWMCCLWYSVGFPDGWVLRDKIVDGTGTSLATGFHEWITSFYWAITTMSTIGYGDIAATTTSERGVASVVMLLGCGFFAWATGRLTQILTKTSKCTANFESKMEELNEYLAARSISRELVDKTTSFYMLKFPTMRMFDESAILGDLPTELRKEVLLELFQDVISMAPMFQLCSPKLRKELCCRLHSRYVEAGAVIMREGEVPDAMFVVRFGFVSVTCQDQEVMLAERGDVIGENALFGLSEIKRRKRTAKALTACELCVLKADALKDLLIEFPEMQTIVTKMAKLKLRELEASFHGGADMSLVDLTCVDWQKYASPLQDALDDEHKRQVSAGVSDEDPERAVHLPLRSCFSLCLRTLTGIDDDDQRSSLVFVVVRCRDQGQPEEDESMAETKVFSLQPGQSEVEVDHTVDVTLFHNDNRWSAMPEMRIQVFALPSKAKMLGAHSFRADLCASLALRKAPSRKTSVTNNSSCLNGKFEAQYHSVRDRSGTEESSVRGSKQKNSNVGRTSSCSSSDFQDCTLLWEGGIAPHVLIAHREKDGFQPTISVPLTPGPGRQSHAELVLGVSVRRKLRAASGWIRMIPVLKEKGRAMGGKFFLAKYRQTLDSMSRAVESFGHEVRGWRVARAQELFHLTRDRDEGAEQRAVTNSISQLQKEMRENHREVREGVLALARALRRNGGQLRGGGMEAPLKSEGRESEGDRSGDSGGTAKSENSGGEIERDTAKAGGSDGGAGVSWSRNGSVGTGDGVHAEGKRAKMSLGDAMLAAVKTVRGEKGGAGPRVSFGDAETVRDDEVEGRERGLMQGEGDGGGNGEEGGGSGQGFDFSSVINRLSSGRSNGSLGGWIAEGKWERRASVDLACRVERTCSGVTSDASERAGSDGGVVKAWREGGGGARHWREGKWEGGGEVVLDQVLEGQRAMARRQDDMERQMAALKEGQDRILTMLQLLCPTPDETKQTQEGSTGAMCGGEAGGPVGGGGGQQGPAEAKGSVVSIAELCRLASSAEAEPDQVVVPIASEATMMRGGSGGSSVQQDTPRSLLMRDQGAGSWK